MYKITEPLTSEIANVKNREASGWLRILIICIFN